MRTKIYQVIAVGALLLAARAYAAEPILQLGAIPPHYEPEIDMRDVHVPRVGGTDIELGPYVGIMNFEDFGASDVTGVRLAIHVTEFVFLEANIGRASVSDTTFRRLGIPRFEREHEDVTYQHYVFGYNLFPGEIFIGRRLAFTSGAYIVAGAGNTRFIDEDWFTLVFGMGIRLLANDWLALHVDAKTHEYTSSLLGREKPSHNMEAHAGLSVFF